MKQSRRFLAIVFALMFLIGGTLDLAIAKGSSSFGGGSRGSSYGGSSSSRGSSSFSSSRGSSSSSSSSWGSSSSSSSGKSSGSGFFGSSSSSSTGGGSSFFGSKSSSSGSSGFSKSPSGSASTPSTSSSSGSSGFSNSKGDSSGSSSSGSVFSSRVNNGIDSNKSTASSGNSWSFGRKSGSGSITSGYTPSNRTTIIYRERPSGWAPSYYGYSPTGDLIDFWWKMEMLKSINDRNERDRAIYELKHDPNYTKWHDEAQRLASENADLKEQLSKIDNEGNITDDQYKAMSAPVEEKGGSWGWFWWLLGLGLIGYFGYRFFKRS